MRAILTFHNVDASGSVLSIAPEELRSLVCAIRASGHAIVPLVDLLGRPAEPDRIALSFDDGLAGLHENAAPVLAEEGAPATVFLTTDYLGRDNGWPTLPADAPRFPMMSWSQVEDLHRGGWAVEAHTATHPDLRRLDDAGVECEFERCDDAIAARLGVRPQILAYPYGSFDARVEALAARRYAWSVTAELGRLPTRAAGRHRLPRLETFYFRAPRIHARFGTRLFDAYLAGRGLARRLRRAREDASSPAPASGARISSTT